MHVLKRMCGYSHYGLKITRMFSTQTNVDYTKDYYAVLGLQRGASDAQIKNSFYAKAKQYHPDVKKGYEQTFKRINQAYQILSDPKIKKDYDSNYGKRSSASEPSSQSQNQSNYGNPYGNYSGYYNPYSNDYNPFGNQYNDRRYSSNFRYENSGTQQEYEQAHRRRRRSNANKFFYPNNFQYHFFSHRGARMQNYEKQSGINYYLYSLIFSGFFLYFFMVNHEEKKRNMRHRNGQVIYVEYDNSPSVQPTRRNNEIYYYGYETPHTTSNRDRY